MIRPRLADGGIAGCSRHAHADTTLAREMGYGGRSKHEALPAQRLRTVFEIGIVDVLLPGSLEPPQHIGRAEGRHYADDRHVGIGIRTHARSAQAQSCQDAAEKVGHQCLPSAQRLPAVIEVEVMNVLAAGSGWGEIGQAAQHGEHLRPASTHCQ